MQYFAPPVTVLIAWPVFGDALGLPGFVGLFIIAGVFFRSIEAGKHWITEPGRTNRFLLDI